MLTSESFDGVVDGKDVNPLAVFHLGTRLDGDDVTQAHAQIVAHDAIQPNLVVGDCVVGQNDAHGLTTLFAWEKE